MKLNYYMHVLFGLVMLSMGLCNAQASTIHEEFQVVFDSKISTTAIPVSQAGTYKAVLVDFESPEAFDFLVLGITQDHSPLGFRFGTGSFTFDVPSPGTILAHLAAVTGGGGVGTYGVNITTIPLPPALLLFTTALIGLVIVGRRERHTGAF